MRSHVDDSRDEPRGAGPGNLRPGRMARITSLLLLGIVCLVALSTIAHRARSSDGEPKPLPELMAEAETLRGQASWNEAEAVFRQIVARANEDRAIAALAQVGIGRCLTSKGDPANAQIELQRVADLYADQPAAINRSRLYLIECFQAQGRGSDAQNLAQALADEAASPEFQAWGQLKLIEMVMNRPEGWNVARVQLQQLVSSAQSQFPEPANWARVRLAEASVGNGELSQGIAACDAILVDHDQGLASHEQAVWALYRKGQALKRKGELASSLQTLQESASLARQHSVAMVPEPEYQIGEVYHRQGNHTEALNHYQASLDAAQTVRLSDRERDRIRLQIGAELAELGLADKASAWLRMGITDAAQLTESDSELAEQITSALPKERQEAWCAYLVAPSTRPDPTIEAVQTEFAADPPTPSAGAPNLMSQRWLWLGNCREGHRDFLGAEQALDQALAAAGTRVERARILTRQARVARILRGPIAARQKADLASQTWLQDFAAAQSAGAAQYAIHMMIASYTDAGFAEEAIPWLESIVAALNLDAQPGEATYARYRLVQEYIGCQRRADAKSLAENTLAQILDRPFSQYHTYLCSELLLNLAYAYASDGEFSTAQNTITRLEQHWPESMAAVAAAHHSIIENMSNGSR